MTTPWSPMGAGGTTDAKDFFDPSRAQGHLLLVRIHAVAKHVVTKHCPDGWKRSEGKEPMPNNGLQISVVDLNWQNPDGSLGKVYPEALLITGTLVAKLKREVGATKLIMWKQAPEPRDQYGNPRQTNPYDITDMSGNEQAAAAANNFLAAHPEFMQIPVPPPYEPREQPPAPPAPAYPQQQPGYGYPPQQPGYAPPQHYPQQPGQMPWGQIPPPQPQWTPPAQPQQPPWQPQAPAPQPQWQQQPPAPQGPPPGYPPQQQAAPASFFDAAQQMPPGQQPQGPAVNHYGQPQPQQPPF